MTYRKFQSFHKRGKTKNLWMDCEKDDMARERMGVEITKRIVDSNVLDPEFGYVIVCKLQFVQPKDILVYPIPDAQHSHRNNISKRKQNNYEFASTKNLLNSRRSPVI